MLFANLIDSIMPNQNRLVHQTVHCERDDMRDELIGTMHFHSSQPTLLTVVAINSFFVLLFLAGAVCFIPKPKRI